MYVTQGLKRAVLVNRSGIATVDGERQQTWGEFAERVAKLAGALQQLGLETGGRVAILAFNSDRYLEYYFAIAWAGGVIVPLNTRLANPELAYMLNDAGAEILVVDDSHRDNVPDLTVQTTSIRHVIAFGDQKSTADLHDHEAILNAAAPIPDQERGGDDIAGIFYTGGTTGQSKGVMLTHDNLVTNAMTALLNMVDDGPWNYLHSAPMFHIADAQWVVGVTLRAGTHVFVPRFIPEAMLKTIETYRITHCALVPTMVLMLCNVADQVDCDLSSLRVLNYGGSAMSPAIIAKARAVFTHCRFFQGYGQTETAPNISMLPDQYHTLDGPNAAKVESAGIPVATIEVKIIDEDDNALAANEVGEIAVRGPNIMAGYWNKPEESAHALRGGWMHTGDIGYLDEDGFLFIVDRLKDVIISGGENIYSSEVEHIIYQIPAVAMCAVIGIPHEQWGETVHAVIVAKDGQSLSEADVISHCRAHIAGYKCPRSVDIHRGPLPMSGAGKILKRELRAPFWAGKTRQIN